MKEILLTQGQIAIVDDQDYEWLAKWKWCAVRRKNSYYALRHEGVRMAQKNIFMHRVITNSSDGMDVDHINGNGLDNRRSNLRICTHAENNKNRRKQKNNTTGFKGVSPSGRKYQAQISVNNKNIHLGTFSTPEDAAYAYDEAAKKHYGKFAKTNF
jgi:hypothetical protein